MAVIKITNFGGIAPSVDPRNLTPEGAQTAQNLDMRFGDFRPVKGAGTAVATVAAGTQSIFRTPAGQWLSSTNDVNYVNGQISDAAYERVYLTGRTVYPEAWQANAAGTSGTYRQLGVPAPTAAPGVAVEAVDDFTQTDADAAQLEAQENVLSAVTGLQTDVYYGNNIPANGGGLVVDPDALYSSVVLHLQFGALPLVDSSPQKRVITKGNDVTLSSATPLLTGGGSYGVFSGANSETTTAISFPRISYDRNSSWAADAKVSSTVALTSLKLHHRNGYVFAVTGYSAAGQGYTLFGESGSHSLIWNTFSFAVNIPANTPTLVSLQNQKDLGVRLYINGVYVGRSSFADAGIFFEYIGYERVFFYVKYIDAGESEFVYTTKNPWSGSIDEVRITIGLRYVGTTSFAVPNGPYSPAASVLGLWAKFGDTLLSPAIQAQGDAVYLIALTISGATYTATNPADQYLLDGSLGGSEVTYSGTRYWAVPITKYRALGKTVNETAITTALDALTVPTLDATQSAELASTVFDLHDPTTGTALTLISTLNSRQAELQNLLAGTATTAAQLSTGIKALQSASAAVATYYNDLTPLMKKALVELNDALFGSLAEGVVTQIFETRAYIVTFVTDWDEESAPSAPSALVQLDQTDAANISVSGVTGGRNIVGWRLYRSSTSNSGAAFQLVEPKTTTTVDGVTTTAWADNAITEEDTFKYFDIANLTYRDTKAQEELQETCATLTWVEPPANLKGLVGLPNGIMCGFFGKTLCFSEPFAPYAWPIEYQQTLEYDIVGIGVFGQTAVVLTKGNPYFVSGADSASMSAQKMESPQACIAKRTIAAVEGGVMYASPDGLCYATPSGVSVFTQGAYNRADWQAIATSGAFGAFHEGTYYLFAV